MVELRDQKKVVQMAVQMAEKKVVKKEQKTAAQMALKMAEKKAVTMAEQKDQMWVKQKAYSKAQTKVAQQVALTVAMLVDKMVVTQEMKMVELKEPQRDRCWVDSRVLMKAVLTGNTRVVTSVCRQESYEADMMAACLVQKKEHKKGEKSAAYWVALMGCLTVALKGLQKVFPMVGWQEMYLVEQRDKTKVELLD